MSYIGKFRIISTQPYSKGLYDSIAISGFPVPPPVNINVISTENNVIIVSDQDYMIEVV